MYHIFASPISLTLPRAMFTFPEMMPPSPKVMSEYCSHDNRLAGYVEACELKVVTGQDVEGSFSGVEIVADLTKVTLTLRKMFTI
jgi:hypothetical protein